MKPSRYNIFIDANEYAFIYNTLTKSLLLVDDKVRHHLERNQLERIDLSILIDSRALRNFM